MDKYGGLFENCYCFLCEIIDFVNEVWDGLIFVCILVNDYYFDGLMV